MLKMTDAFTQKCINTIRVLSADMVEKANSGHPGQWFRVALDTALAMLSWNGNINHAISSCDEVANIVLFAGFCCDLASSIELHTPA